MDATQTKTLRFFREAYDELLQLCSDNELTDYKINQISRILRQFLFDDKSVASEAAKLVMGRKRRSFSFYCNPYKPLFAPNQEMGGIYDGFHPEPDMPFSNSVKISRQALGSQLLFEYQGKAYNLRQLVKYIANKEGGVHFDQTDLDVTEQELKEMQDYFWVGGRSALTSMLRAVGLVVLDGFKDLREACNSK